MTFWCADYYYDSTTHEVAIGVYVIDTGVTNLKPMYFGFKGVMFAKTFYPLTVGWLKGNDIMTVALKNQVNDTKLMQDTH